MVMKILIPIFWIVTALNSCLILRSAALSILAGNVSKSRKRRIIKEQKFWSNLQLDFVIPYANRYLTSLKRIIVFAKVYLCLFFVQLILCIALSIVNISVKSWIYLYVFTLVLLHFPVYLFDFFASYHGIGKQKRGWKYKIDGKEHRRSKKK